MDHVQSPDISQINNCVPWGGRRFLSSALKVNIGFSSWKVWNFQKLQWITYSTTKNCTKLIYYIKEKCAVQVFKMINAQQTKLYNTYKNTKLKLLKTNAAIWFKKMCRANRLTTKYFNIRINDNKQQTRKTRLAAIKYRINQEIRFLQCKKQTLNDRLYHINLECIT